MVQLDFTQEIKVLYMLFRRCYLVKIGRDLLNNTHSTYFRCKIRLYHPANKALHKSPGHGPSSHWSSRVSGPRQSFPGIGLTMTSASSRQLLLVVFVPRPQDTEHLDHGAHAVQWISGKETHNILTKIKSGFYTTDANVSIKYKCTLCVIHSVVKFCFALDLKFWLPIGLSSS